ncbi:uncharacterized protein FPRO_03414 [Fusarium proliferatum ET1]|uniref:Uncharacterized protein n=1 Tax=Fusarium proliferatum (strain ET1) TaxID=1227346 RepID=A0A1L7V9T4_FUSPR|nr:uncharacterized protein FPRO_03414 [Fusarium proliferatum ET1]CZR36326.1 uncharacterized protein FPRO_03414 [Fusarium proliferatum ET1]
MVIAHFRLTLDLPTGLSLAYSLYKEDAQRQARDRGPT